MIQDEAKLDLYYQKMILSLHREEYLISASIFPVF